MRAQLAGILLLTRARWGSLCGVLVASVAAVTVVVALFAPVCALAAVDDLPERWVRSGAVTTNGQVNAVARHPGTGLIIIGGRFTQVCDVGGCKDRRNLAVLSAPDKVAPQDTITNQPQPNDEVYALAITGALDWRPESGKVLGKTRPVVWVGGRFGQVDGKTRKGLFGFELWTGSIVEANPLRKTTSTAFRLTVPTVTALAVGRERKLAAGTAKQTLYIGGEFRSSPDACDDLLAVQENLASYTVETRPQKVLGSYNSRWVARARWPVTALAMVPVGPWEGLLVATARGVDYGSGLASQRFGRGPVVLLTGTTGAPHSWQPEILVTGSGGVEHMVFDEVVAETKIGGFALDVSGDFGVAAGNQRGVKEGPKIFGRLNVAGGVDVGFDGPAADGVVAGALALAGRVRYVDGSAQSRWLIRATNRGLVVVDAVFGERVSAIGMSDVGGGGIRSVLAVPGLGIMAAGDVPGGVAFFAWPAGSGGRRVIRRSGSRAPKGRVSVRGRSGGSGRKLPVQVFGGRVDAVEPYPGGVAIGGAFDRVCPAGEPQESARCAVVGGLAGLRDDGSALRWKESVSPKQVFDLAWVGHTRTLLVGGAFTRVGSENRRDLVELEIPHGSTAGPVTVTPLDWLGRQGTFRRVSPWPGIEGVTDIDYDSRTETTAVAGNFATGEYVVKGQNCAEPAMRIMRLGRDLRPDRGFELQLGNDREPSVVSSVASFAESGASAAKRGYLLGFNYTAFREGQVHAVGDLLLVDTKGKSYASARFAGVDQIDEVHRESGQTTALRALVQDTSGGSRVSKLLTGKLAAGGYAFDLEWLSNAGITRPTAVEGAPDGSYYVAGEDDDGLQTIVHASAGGDSINLIASGGSGEITRLVLSGDGRYLYAAGSFRGLIDYGSGIARDLFTAIPLQG